MRKIVIPITTLFLSLSVYGAEVAPNGEENLINSVEAVHPPEPSEASHANIEGLDIDADGIRDDIENFIRIRYSSRDEYTRNSLYNIAKFYTGYLSGNNDAIFNDYQKNIHSPLMCLKHRLGPADGKLLSASIEAYSLTSIARSLKFNRDQGKFLESSKNASLQINPYFGNSSHNQRLVVNSDDINCDTNWSEDVNGVIVPMCLVYQSYCLDQIEWNQQ